ncbi:uncharacterized protein Z520_00002 [Fonsecaea multimorphosa CBS 102226]|uniref:Heterokaryon incompatibility domain-containing protein n=1 Tax=Fonsecaea multimorphosa CBS 102226 TaxID=1442371 RepID=A0A0D2J1Q7_9EURO|nr:uncharacterized protein Z520_00002 [Fonsecaea multimorphosa CBS 102226]KIY03312.1 hypothetical protein Z520_00002 [Fonsecaea multimorphosa CBS 102226]OAL32963.1 hypothetical protein AYO22_00048 [Fonsecaea multimorphosa]
MNKPRGYKARHSLEKAVETIYGLDAGDLLLCPLAQIQDTDLRLWRLRLSCTPLLTGVHHPIEHFDKLDQQLSVFLQRPDSFVRDTSHRDGALFHDMCSKAEKLLARLPEVPQRSFSLPLNNGIRRKQGTTLWDSIKNGKWATKYIVPEAQFHFQLQSSEDADSVLTLLSKLQNLAWDNFYVTTHIDTNSLILAAVFANQGSVPDLRLARNSLEYVNLLSELFDEYQSMCDAVSFGIQAPFEDDSDEGRALKDALFPQERDDHEQAMTIVKVFLWSAWQRSVMLHFYYVVGVQLAHGYSSTWNTFLAIRGVHELESLSRDAYRGKCTDYLCNWAFELLRTSRTSVGLDFRRMISRFDAQFHGRHGRCIRDSTSTCEGGQPETCQRFTAAEAAAQSAHSPGCNGHCSRILWNAPSYFECRKPAAIAAIENSAYLNYSPVSCQTLAISHVWSHGQGGRPETGINTCLHHRYCRLARQFGCDTYWIDAACIPSETTLRRQAIDSINEIFAASKVTLVIDMDVQSVDVTLPDPSIAEIETLVSTLLVSDWTVRGWTLLEAMRGSRAIWLLCKNDGVMNLRHALTILHERGGIDIGVLLGSAQHLIPHSDPASKKTVEEAGFLLSQRHTSWPEDVIICWSLLINAPVRKEAAGLWRNQTRVRSGYILSSAPRVGTMKGFGWAPSTPYVRPIKRSVGLENGRSQEYSVRFPSYDGEGSLPVNITEHGLRGKWRVVEVDRSLLESTKDLCCELTPFPYVYEDDEMAFETPQLIYAHPDDALAWLTIVDLLDHGARVRLVRAVAEDGISPAVGTSQRGEGFGLIAALCASLNGGLSWEWKGVYSWQESENYEGWEVVEMLIT